MILDVVFSSHWYWLVAGVLLIAAEALVPGVLLLWIGLGAMAVGIFIAAWPDAPLSIQLIVLALSMLIFVVVGLRLQSRAKLTDSDSTLNAGISQYKGRHGVADTDFLGGRGRVDTGDTSHPAMSSEPIKKNDHVVVVDVREGVLYVALVHGSDPAPR